MSRSLLIALVCLAGCLAGGVIGCNSRNAPASGSAAGSSGGSEVAERPYDPKSPRVMEMRMLAGKNRHQVVIELAQKQQDQESKLKQPWTDLVEEPETHKARARWVMVKEEAVDTLLNVPYVVTRDVPGEKPTKQVLVLLDPYNITSDQVVEARPGFDTGGEPCVFFTLSRNGGNAFERFTSMNLPQNGEFSHLGIILESKLQTAPRLQSTISDHGQISGNFTEAETKRIAAILTAK